MDTEADPSTPNKRGPKSQIKDSVRKQKKSVRKPKVRQLNESSQKLRDQVAG